MAKKRQSSRRKQTLQLEESKKTTESSSRRSQTGVRVCVSENAATQAQAQSQPSSSESQKSEEEIDSQVANFLKELTALGKEDAVSENRVEYTPANQEEGEETGEKQSRETTALGAGSSCQVESISTQEQQSCAGEEEKEEEMATTEQEVTFWQQLTDPKTNHTYYWNPTTNEVSWTLPSYGVITEQHKDPPLPPQKQQAVKQDGEGGEGGGGGMVVEVSEGGGTGEKAGPVRDSVKHTQVSALPSPSVSSPASEQVLRFQVSSLADEFTRKLDYLHISEQGLSDLQVLKLQLQTRLSDWREGGIGSKFMLGKLKEASKKIKEYEQSAAPGNWICEWDSGSCRYAYLNTVTGEKSWDYPLKAAMSQAEAMETILEEEEEEPIPTVPERSHQQPPAAPPVLNSSASDVTDGVATYTLPPPPMPLNFPAPPAPLAAAPIPSPSTSTTTPLPHPPPPAATAPLPLPSSTASPLPPPPPPPPSSTAAAAPSFPSTATMATVPLRPTTPPRPHRRSRPIIGPTLPDDYNPSFVTTTTTSCASVPIVTSPEKIHVEVFVDKEIGGGGGGGGGGGSSSNGDLVVQMDMEETLPEEVVEYQQIEDKEEEGIEQVITASAIKDESLRAHAHASLRGRGGGRGKEIEDDAAAATLSSTVLEMEVIPEDYVIVEQPLPLAGQEEEVKTSQGGAGDLLFVEEEEEQEIVVAMPPPPDSIVEVAMVMDDQQEAQQQEEEKELVSSVVATTATKSTTVPTTTDASDIPGVQWMGGITIEGNSDKSTGPPLPPDRNQSHDHDQVCHEQEIAYTGEEEEVETSPSSEVHVPISMSMSSIPSSDNNYDNRSVMEALEEGKEEREHLSSLATVPDIIEQYQHHGESAATDVTFIATREERLAEYPSSTNAVTVVGDAGQEGIEEKEKEKPAEEEVVTMEEQLQRQQAEVDVEKQPGVSSSEQERIVVDDSDNATAAKEDQAMTAMSDDKINRPEQDTTTSKLREEGVIIPERAREHKSISPQDEEEETKTGRGSSSGVKRSGHRRSRSRSHSHGRSRSRSREDRRHSSRRSSRRRQHDYPTDDYYGSGSSKYRSSRKKHRRRDNSDHSDSDDYGGRRSSRYKRSRHHDYYSDHSDDGGGSRSRRSRDYYSSDEDRRKRRRHSRSPSKESRDSHERSKRKKKDKKDKKKKHSQKSPPKESPLVDKTKKATTTPHNIMVGKVGSVGSIRPLGEKKSTSAMPTTPSDTKTMGAGGGGHSSSPSAAMNPSNMYMYYQQTSYPLYASAYQYPNYQWDQGQGVWQQGGGATEYPPTMQQEGMYAGAGMATEEAHPAAAASTGVVVPTEAPGVSVEGEGKVGEGAPVPVPSVAPPEGEEGGVMDAQVGSPIPPASLNASKDLEEGEIPSPKPPTTTVLQQPSQLQGTGVFASGAKETKYAQEALDTNTSTGQLEKPVSPKVALQASSKEKEVDCLPTKGSQIPPPPVSQPLLEPTTAPPPSEETITTGARQRESKMASVPLLPGDKPVPMDTTASPSPPPPPPPPPPFHPPPSSPPHTLMMGGAGGKGKGEQELSLPSATLVSSLQPEHVPISPATPTITETTIATGIPHVSEPAAEEKNPLPVVATAAISDDDSLSLARNNTAKDRDEPVSMETTSLTPSPVSSDMLPPLPPPPPLPPTTNTTTEEEAHHHRPISPPPPAGGDVVMATPTTNTIAMAGREGEPNTPTTTAQGQRKALKEKIGAEVGRNDKPDKMEEEMEEDAGDRTPPPPPLPPPSSSSSSSGAPSQSTPTTSTSAATSLAQQQYNYAAAGYSQQPYDYSTVSGYAQAQQAAGQAQGSGYDYTQAYSAYVQAAAASMAYATYGQYYGTPYAYAASAASGYSPYAAMGYYNYGSPGAYQSPTAAQVAGSTQSTSSTLASASADSKKKEKATGSMIKEWAELKTQYEKTDNKSS